MLVRTLRLWMDLMVVKPWGLHRLFGMAKFMGLWRGFIYWLPSFLYISTVLTYFFDRLMLAWGFPFPTILWIVLRICRIIRVLSIGLFRALYFGVFLSKLRVLLGWFISFISHFGFIRWFFPVIFNSVLLLIKLIILISQVVFNVSFSNSEWFSDI